MATLRAKARTNGDGWGMDRMRSGWVGLVCILMAAGGCRHPISICTDVRAQLDAPLRDPEPLRQVALEPASCGGAKVALVDVDGLLFNMNMTGPLSAGENPVELFREKLDAIARDPGFRAVVLRIHSPGGGVTASDIMWQDLQRFKARTQLPVVACLMDVATGGAYYLATAADQIWAHPTTVTGAIGVILNRYNLENAGDALELGSYRPVKSGKYTDMGTPLSTLDEEAERVLQETARQFHLRFQEIVRRARPLRVAAPIVSAAARSGALPPSHPGQDPSSALPGPASFPPAWDADSAEEAFPEWCDGRVFTASKALELGLIDRIGYLDDAIECAKQMSHCADATATILHRRKDPARSAYAITPNSRTGLSLLNVSVPMLERSRFPTFMYVWLLEPTMDSISGR